MRTTSAFIAIAALARAPVFAAEPVVAVADPKALLTDPDPMPPAK